MTKTIGLNALFLNPQSGGLGVYMYKLIDFLCRSQVPLETCIFFARDTFPQGIPEHGKVRFVKIPLRSRYPLERIACEAVTWPFVLRNQGIDMFHSPLSYIPLGVNRPAILTIHDLRAFREPKAYTFLRGNFIRRMIARSAQRAHHIIAISEFTRREIIELLNVAPDKITIIPQGVDRHRFNRSANAHEWQHIQKLYNLPNHYILSVGHLEPRKNYERLLYGYHLLLQQKSRSIPPLVIVGRENWKFNPIYQTVEKLNLKDRVRFTHFVAAEHLPSIYQNAVLFITASTYEGFGITPLEAMAAGIPVACSNVSALPEVVGNAALLFDPFSIDDIARAIDQLLNQTDFRMVLGECAAQRVKMFDWDVTCRQTLQTFQLLVDSL